MLSYPNFYEFEKNKQSVMDFLETMPILRNGNRSIILEPKYYDIKQMADPKITPDGSYWNLIPYDDWDAQEAAPEHNQWFYSEIKENAIGSMWSFLENKCGKKELNDWIVPSAMADKDVKERVRQSLYDSNDCDRFEIVWADLRGIILSLIIYGESNSFTGGIEGDEYKLYCQVRKAYYAGGFPYGWTGDYPTHVKLFVHFD